MTDDLNVNQPGASALLGQPIPIPPPMTQAEARARLVHIKDDPEYKTLDAKKATEVRDLRRIATGFENVTLGTGVDAPATMKALADQNAARDRIFREGLMVAIDADVEVTNHELNNLLVSAADKQFAARERPLLIRDKSFQDRALGKAPDSSERIYGRGGPNDRKFTAREWLQRLDRTLLARVQK